MVLVYVTKAICCKIYRITICGAKTKGFYVLLNKEAVRTLLDPPIKLHL